MGRLKLDSEANWLTDTHTGRGSAGCLPHLFILQVP